MDVSGARPLHNVLDFYGGVKTKDDLINLPFDEFKDSLLNQNCENISDPETENKNL